MLLQMREIKVILILYIALPLMDWISMMNKVYLNQTRLLILTLA